MSAASHHSASDTCPTCGFKSPSGFLFCGQCGTKLTTKEAERRLLTILFCDLVDSTSMFRRLDPEDERDVVLSYRQACERAVSHFGGYITTFVGNGVQVCFGYPQAHDKDAIMAVDAAVALVADVGRLNDMIGRRYDLELRVRIAVHTGLVVAGELGAGKAYDAYSFTGGVMNIAARLQELAKPNGIVISKDTYQVVRDFFVFRELPPARLKGLPDAVIGFQLVDHHHSGSYATDLGRRRLPRLIGRDDELDRLMEYWQKAESACGQTVMLVGEPGIGKSRLVRALRDALPPGEHQIVVLHCSEHTRYSAFSPIIALLRELLELNSGDHPIRKLEALQAKIGLFGLGSSDVVPLLAALLDVATPEIGADPDLSIEARRRRTMEILISAVTLTAARRPVLLVVEDLHWADPSTIELFCLIQDRIQSSPILVVGTARPEFHPPWGPQQSVVQIDLARLSSGHVRLIVTNLAGGKPLPDSALTQLLEKAEGVPLFVEELTKVLLATRRFDDDLEEKGFLAEATIPAALHSSLMARLDRLGSAKMVAQTASILGRTFSYDLLLAIYAGGDAELRAGLAQLVNSEIVFARGENQRGSFSFKHALIRDVAYHSLLRGTRRELHRRSAVALREQSPEAAASMPELIAQHYMSAGEASEALDYWRRAGLRALKRSSNTEAMAHLRAAISALMQLPETPGRNQLEVTLQIALGMASTAAMGYAASSAEVAYGRARSLCEALGDTAHRFSALRGLQSFYIVRGPLAAAHGLGRRLIRLAEDQNDRFLLTESHRAFGWGLFCSGAMVTGREHLQRAAELYDHSSAQRHIEMLGTDAGVMARANLAWVNWFLGNYPAAIDNSERAVAEARELGHAHSLAYGLCVSAALNQGLGRPRVTQRLSDETINLADKHNFAYWTAWGTILQGWACAKLGDVQQRLATMTNGLSLYRATGAELFRSYSLCLIAEISKAQGGIDEGLTLVEEALGSIRKSNVHFYEAELFRVHGELLDAIGDPDGAMVAFEQSLYLSARQHARSLTLRAASSSYRFQHGRRGEEASRQILAASYKAVLQSFDTPDMGAVRTLLGLPNDFGQ
jgi:class 3 adenylate cyclase/predicted ATPase/energy-coupling factor transporter ATP-binding protein EcfA2